MILKKINPQTTHPPKTQKKTKNSVLSRKVALLFFLVVKYTMKNSDVLKCRGFSLKRKGSQRKKRKNRKEEKEGEVSQGEWRHGKAGR